MKKPLKNAIKTMMPMNEEVELWIDARKFKVHPEQNHQWFLAQLHHIRYNMLAKYDFPIEITGIIIDFDQARDLYSNLRMNFELEIGFGKEPTKICGIPVFEMHPMHTVSE